ncbi:MAG: helix-turn-helix protein [Rhodocyclales bacterium]|nr:helix-turn-helix protein [Rhodocyclales bacterium]
MSDGPEFESSMGENPDVPLTAWQMLREAREARGLTIIEVAQHLKLTPRQVEAMEAGDLAHLPGPAFARGFVRNYARFLQLDPAHFNSVLDVVREVPQPFNTLPLGQMPGPARWRFSSLPALGVAAVLLALAVAGWYYGWFEPREEQYLADVMEQSGVPAETGASMPMASASVPQAEQSGGVNLTPSAPSVDIVAASAVVVASASASSAASSPVAAPVATAASSSSRMSSSSAASSAGSVAVSAVVSKPASAPVAQSAVPISGPVPKGSHRLRFAFDADAWVEVKDASGKVVFSRLNPAGSEQEVQGEAPLQLVIGNAPQVRLSVDGKATELTSRTTSNVARFSLP